MAGVTDDLLEELVTIGNEMNGTKDTVSRMPNSDLLVLNHVENGSTVEDLVQPLNHLFQMSTKKPYLDVEYVQQQRADMAINVEKNHEDLNLFDLNTFLRAIVPSQRQLMQRIEEQCHVHPQFLALVERLPLLDTRCDRSICHGRILAESKFGADSRSISFAVAHPPFVYELESLLERRNGESLVDTYLSQLQRFLIEDKLDNDSCVLCLAFDLYCTDTVGIENFRLFFLEDVSPVSMEHDTLDLLYETQIEVYNKTDQCLVFDDVLGRIRLICLTEERNNETTNWFLRYSDGSMTKLYF
jgi:hypothetical protein